jgi:hypothetical protein
MKLTRVVNQLNHFKLIDMMTEICDESIIVCFRHFIKRFHHLENVVRENIELFNQFNKWIHIKVAIQKRRWLHVCLNNVFEIQIHFEKDDDETYNQTLIDSLNNKALSQYKISILIIKCLNYETRFFKRFVNVEMLYFIYQSRIEYTSAREYVDLIYWLKNIFFNQFFCLKAANWENDVWFVLNLTMRARTRTKFELIKSLLKTKLR